MNFIIGSIFNIGVAVALYRYNNSAVTVTKLFASVVFNFFFFCCINNSKNKIISLIEYIISPFCFLQYNFYMKLGHCH